MGGKGSETDRLKFLQYENERHPGQADDGVSPT